MNSEDNNLQSLKEKLNLELQKEVSDNDLILELSHQIANLDLNNIRFSVDAGVINRLGRELVGRNETAVSELVKNAYDSDALSVNLYFEQCDRPGGKLVIDDTGLGMTRDQLVKGFMTISSSDKIHNPKSLRYGRTRAGQKGIGRFATQRIGEILTIITQTLDSDKALKVTINWDKYEIDSNLLLISNKIEEIPKEKDEGTTLIIDKVREGWSDSMIQRAYKYISDLLQPFPLSERLEKNEKDPGFKVTFYRNGNLIIDEESAFFQHALAEIEAYVDEEGQGYYSFKSDKLSIPEELYLVGKKDREDKYDALRNVHLKAYYFIYNGNQTSFIPKTVNSYILENAKEHGGIRLYRNGFRVLPYAEKNDDWLTLDASMRRRSILAAHSNLHFFGFVEVIDKDGINFQELSSREGLLETLAFAELKDFGYKVLTDVAVKISQIRLKKGTAGQKDWDKKTSLDIIKEVKQEFNEIIIDDEINKNQNNPDSKQDISIKLKTINEKIIELELVQQQETSESEEKTKELVKEIQMLRILAGLGLTIGEFVHEVNHYEPAFKYDAEYLTNFVEDSHAKNVGYRLQKNLEAFTVYTSFFKDAISKNVNRELKPIELREPVSSFIEIITPDLERSNIALEKPNFNGYNLFTCPMHSSEWSSILFNFYTNSKKAIAKKAVLGKISIDAGKIGKKVYLEFSDNGIGIAPEKEDQIFDAFYTTSNPSGNNSTELEELSGTGLGLKIVKDIIEGYGGEVFVTKPKENYSTTIRIELPKTEINDYE
ncbi:ATP-binding protein [Flavobacterium nitrogenifigens]|uniref:histidine kinase n=1 Tax=Flavobacterium nitrogenifigens TaxID=1617283 RepID=A0A521DTN1_9FLAO|nr:ATP-binding protein [Flavobacterium nitrogenifigens]KAF2327477.1 ATP-binding protein [Flavobacterium nitrogenifigens]SMO74200.1 histidine kinase [Flavobacterium nitrogenifigens]